PGRAARAESIAGILPLAFGAVDHGVLDKAPLAASREIAIGHDGYPVRLLFRRAPFQLHLGWECAGKASRTVRAGDGLLTLDGPGLLARAGIEGDDQIGRA